MFYDGDYHLVSEPLPEHQVLFNLTNYHAENYSYSIPIFIG